MANEERGDQMSGREAVFANIRRSLGVTGAEAPRLFEVRSRLAEAPQGIVPRRGQGDIDHRIETFKFEASRVQATLAEVGSLPDAPGEVARFLRDSNCSASIRMGADERLATLPWGATSLEVVKGASDGHDPNAVSMAFAGIAETGTLVLVSGPANPTTLNFLPENHIVLLRREDIVADYESIFSRLRTAYGKGGAPRTLNFVTGPSRSADIEQTLLLGAHGPRRLHIVIAG
jgi:L-lactate dehydrogenase complex protein LldG